ncbi:sugar ABC transporter substrate-binding protein [Ahrensia kielensis]|uniref:Sugar ABC transporter substrate-binding protein n=1 Tax=Ahrensia kielensis TaxID=76980 RepID=A0ABU9TAQ1_9HYPH
MMITKIIKAGLISATLLTSTGLSAHAESVLKFRFNDGEREEMRAALDEFEAANPDIKVELQTISWKDARDQFLREAAVGQGPDVAHIAFVWTKEMAEAGVVKAIEDLTQYGEFANGFDDFIATDLTQYNGKAYGVPWSADTWAMVYRTDLLEQAGIEELPKTWNELKAASTAVKQTTSNSGFSFPGASQIWFPVNYYLWSNDKGFIVEDGNGGYKLGVTKEDVVDAMNYFKSFIDDGEAPSSIVTIDQPHDPSILQALLDGQQAMAVMPTNTYRQLLSAFEEANPGEPVPFMSGPMMAGTGEPKTHLGGRTLVVNENTANPEDAWKLVQFLTSAQLFEKYYTNQFPAQKSLLSEIEYRPEEKGFSTQLANYTRTWGPYAESKAQLGQMWNVTSRAFSASLSGQKTSEVSAEELIAEISRMIED